MFRIKICGVTSVEDALTAARAGADAVGLNFYPKSRRFVDAETARRIVAALPADVVKVGLFVNAPVAEVCRSFDQLKLDLIQLHGDEPPTYLAQLGGRPVLRAFRLSPGRLQPVLDYLDECRTLACEPRLVLLDAAVAGQFGGTGKLADWQTAAQYPSGERYPRLVLAGGLNPENVGDAIQQVQPAAVDTSSGVECTTPPEGHSPGSRKDPDKIRAFVEAARAAFEQIQGG